MSLSRSAVLRAVLICLSLTLSPALRAQDVQLRSQDGSVTLEGNLIAYDGAYYRLETIYGPLTIAAEGVRCAGPGCPDLGGFVAEARIAGEANMTEGLLPPLLQGFAQDRGMTLQPPQTVSDGMRYALARADGSIAAVFHVMPGTSDTGLLALLNGETDMAISLREASEAERRADNIGAKCPGHTDFPDDNHVAGGSRAEQGLNEPARRHRGGSGQARRGQDNDRGYGEDGDQQQVFHVHGGLRPCDGGCLAQSRPVMMSAPGSPGAKTPYLTTSV